MSNREIKKILEKTLSVNKKDWAAKLDDALWAYRIAYKHQLGHRRISSFMGRKLKSRWSGSFEVVRVTLYGAIDLRALHGERKYLVNGQRVKHYWEESLIMRRPK
ncbi:uncharacterized protein LOC142175891 [Nicotiana tabacum]|uniref:Uncharacterized protein LOC142175891 n=1 Tax=Nicotiana tabacum TaxID=4097 RepID=A0AC58TP46_TOBAC